MSQVALMDEEAVPDGVVFVAVAQLANESAFRQRGLCAEHVDRLVELGGGWPPVLIGRGGLVIDGGHRVAAARRLGLAHIAASHFDGTIEEAFIEFVRRNVAHGLPLSLGERKDAAARLLRRHRVWSDRRVAEVCALSPKTVGRLRAMLGDGPTADSADVEVREGRDRRVRPVQRGSVRGKVVGALRSQPGASLRTIAAAVGVSPETVRLVRLNLATEPVDLPPAATAPTADQPASADDHATWTTDAAIASAPRGGDLLAWLGRTDIDPSDLDWAGSVPLSRVYLVAEEARRRSELWLRMANSLEARPARAR